VSYPSDTRTWQISLRNDFWETVHGEVVAICAPA
jgi:hypothetical protein